MLIEGANAKTGDRSQKKWFARLPVVDKVPDKRADRKTGQRVSLQALQKPVTRNTQHEK